MRVLFATEHLYLPQGTGGLEQNTHQLISSLRKRGVEAAVLAGIKPTGPLGLWNRVRRQLQPSIKFPSDKVLGYQVFRGWRPEEGAQEVLARFRPDLVIVQSYNPHKLALAFHRERVPVALYFHDVAMREALGLSDVARGMLCLANSNFTRDHVQDVLRCESVVVPPIVHPEDYKVAASGKAVLFVNPVPSKGVDIACELAERRSDIPFIFIESWVQSSDNRKRYREKLRNRKNVVWRKPTTRMKSLYAQAKLILVPSRVQEGWGRVVTEAQISGIPVLASAQGALPTTVGRGGVLVSPDAGIDEWLRGLSSVWDDPDQYAALSAAAVSHSLRPEIQPEAVVSCLLCSITDFLKNCRPKLDSGEPAISHSPKEPLALTSLPR